MLSPVLLKGSVNADVFYAWVEQALLGELPENSVIVMDNATFHKRSDIREIIEKAEHDVLWLPPYKPRFEPYRGSVGLAKSGTEAMANEIYRRPSFLLCLDIKRKQIVCQQLIYITIEAENARLKKMYAEERLKADLSDRSSGIDELIAFFQNFTQQQLQQPRGCFFQNALLERINEDDSILVHSDAYYANLAQAFSRIFTNSINRGQLTANYRCGTIE